MRYSLRTAFVAITVVALFAAVYLRHVQRNRRAINELVARKALLYSSNTPSSSPMVADDRTRIPFPDDVSLLRRLLTPQRVVEVDLYSNSDRFDDTFLNALVELGTVTKIHIPNSKIIDDGLRRLVNGETTDLDVGFCPITDSSLKAISLCKKLQELDCSNTRVTDSGLRFIKPLSLQKLDLSGTQITDNGVTSISEIRTLRRLALNQTQISDACVKKLAELDQLIWLQIASTKITDEGKSELERLLPRTKISFSANDMPPLPF